VAVAGIAGARLIYGALRPYFRSEEWRRQDGERKQIEKDWAAKKERQGRQMEEMMRRWDRMPPKERSADKERFVELLREAEERRRKN
jgi:hypothetical protein